MRLDELEWFATGLELAPACRLLDVACGAGGPALELARRTGCHVVGVDVDPDAVEHANAAARELGLEELARFVEADASAGLPFAEGAFDAIVCIDAVTHLRGRAPVLREWARLLRAGGRLAFTDPLVVTGVLDSDELAERLSIGYVAIVPPGEDERLLAAAGLEVLAVEDTTAAVAEIAARRAEARAASAEGLVQAEGAEGFERRQRFFRASARLAAEGRVSRFSYLARKPAA
jgi:SAM-dependent methyltransferase